MYYSKKQYSMSLGVVAERPGSQRCAGNIGPDMRALDVASLDHDTDDGHKGDKRGNHAMNIWLSEVHGQQQQ